jgi:tetratricopeptide (TPR) repeat protein
VEAEKHYSRCIELDNKESTFFANRAMVNFRLGKWQETEKDATEALKLDPNNVKAWWRRAMARKSLGNYEGATTDLEKGLMFNPNEVLLIEELRKLRLEREERRSKSSDELAHSKVDDLSKNHTAEPIHDFNVRRRRVVPIREIIDIPDDPEMLIEPSGLRKHAMSFRERDGPKPEYFSTIEPSPSDLARPENSLDFGRTLRSLKGHPEKLYSYIKVSFFIRDPTIEKIRRNTHAIQKLVLFDTCIVIIFGTRLVYLLIFSMTS